ncbi:unnamed protein product [Prorocentrum cordatum]|uniref:Peptidase C14 caspase domain-containing protein n=1 Tax=Prorocentrum cordatum TaxID=2364126 RepID=A0ABN9QXZ4_9DINO|nr:unnamed protein product [Polarella glacialis]
MGPMASPQLKAGASARPEHAGAAPELRTSRRLALVFANGAYRHRRPLSKPVAAAAELRGKLLAMGFEVDGGQDEGLDGMRSATARWLRRVESATSSAEEDSPAPLLIFFAFCGHGGSGRFYPVDCPRGRNPEGTYCFFADFLDPLYEILSWRTIGEDVERPLWALGGQSLQQHLAQWGGAGTRHWRLPGCVHVVSLIESCRRLSPEEQEAYEDARARVAAGRRHILPSLAAQRPDLAHIGGAEWDAARLGGLGDLGAGSPQLLLALSSESTTSSYDAVFLRSVTEAIDRPVRLGGILERAGLDTLRRTGHRQRPVLLVLGAPSAGGGGAATQDLVLAEGPAQPRARGAAPSPPPCGRPVVRMPSLASLRAS